jgi:hypothetical protein
VHFITLILIAMQSAFMAHVDVGGIQAEDGGKVIREMTRILDVRFAIRHVTLQLEWPEMTITEEEEEGLVGGPQGRNRAAPIRGRCRQASWLGPSPPSIGA